MNIDALIEAALEAGDEYGAEVYARARAGDPEAMEEAQAAHDDNLYGAPSGAGENPK